MTNDVPWQVSDIYHDDPESFPLEDYFPLLAEYSDAADSKAARWQDEAADYYFNDGQH
ncbi:MAG: hypothetical protein KGZ79_13885 [Dethiobacter sp.]|jgi:hypothetical protein|nr:hypothetical protein [Dethiobacter sp.]